VPPDINEENVFGENTPTPPRCKTPPKGMLLNWQQSKMVMILRRFGMNQHISMFLEQEVSIICIENGAHENSQIVIINNRCPFRFLSVDKDRSIIASSIV